MKNYRFLIVRQDRIGDAVLSTSLPHEIKKNYPSSFIAVLVRDYTKDIFEHNPYVDEIIILNRKQTLLEFAREIRGHKFDYSFALLPEEFINWGLFLAGIKTRIGVGHKFYQFITNTKSVYRRKYLDKRHEADYCMDFLRKLSIEPDTINPEIFLTTSEREKAGKIRSFFAGKKLIGINSTSGNSAPNIPVEEYKALIIKLQKEHPDLQVIVTDLKVPAEIDEMKNIHYINRNCTLREAIVNFSALDLLISASTGPMHIASALKVPTLAFFCPLPACTPDLWGPLGNKAINIVPEEEYCRIKCPGDPKICKFIGAEKLTIDNIILEMMSILNKL
ncbi:MAG: glycosyltransferase family 9 protein [Bacteroidota bacterium]|nr:glycosyltransferase family 9 protein [Bacteroidota bacterium]